MENFHLQAKYSIRFLSIKLLENDKEINELISGRKNATTIFKIRDEEVSRLATELKSDAESAITDAKYGFISGALKETYIQNNKIKRHTVTSKMDEIVTHKFWGYPVFLLFIFVMFQSTFVLGKFPMNWIENGVNWLSEILQKYMSPGPLKDLFIDGIIGGVGGVIVFLAQYLDSLFFYFADGRYRIYGSCSVHYG